MLCNLATSIFEFHRVETGHAKALEVRRVVERLITYGKRGDLNSRRMASRYIRNKAILRKLFQEIAPKFQERNGGYTRVIKKGFRRGDSAAVSIIELVGIPRIEKKAVVPETTEKASDGKNTESKEQSKK